MRPIPECPDADDHERHAAHQQSGHHEQVHHREIAHTIRTCRTERKHLICDTVAAYYM